MTLPAAPPPGLPPLSTPLLPAAWVPLLASPPQTVAERVAGGVLAVWLGILLAVVGAFLTPLRAFGALVPVALILAVGGNWLLIAVTAELTRRRAAALAPGLVWLALTFIASVPTSEGDLVLTSSNWVATAYLFAGTLTITVAAYRLFSAQR